MAKAAAGQVAGVPQARALGSWAPRRLGATPAGRATRHPPPGAGLAGARAPPHPDCWNGGTWRDRAPPGAPLRRPRRAPPARPWALAGAAPPQAVPGRPLRRRRSHRLTGQEQPDHPAPAESRRRGRWPAAQARAQEAAHPYRCPRDCLCLVPCSYAHCVWLQVIPQRGSRLQRGMSGRPSGPVGSSRWGPVTGRVPARPRRRSRASRWPAPVAQSCAETAA